jgi:hypothetical protein
MPTTAAIAIKELKLDLKNFRTVAQPDEVTALHAMISIAPDRFWALTDSLLDGGYLPTENIIVLKAGANKIVKEGNRRIGALKLILGLISNAGLAIPSEIQTKIDSITTEWKNANGIVPCAVYDSGEETLVDRIVTLTHGKGEKAGRDNWTSVARARHSRDKNGLSEPGLDLLEKYLKEGKNLTGSQGERWAGDFPLTVLDEAMRLIAPRLEFTSSRDLADKYPNTTHRATLESVILDVGYKTLTFDKLRDKQSDYGQTYGIPVPTPPQPTAAGAKTPSTTTASSTPGTPPSGNTGTGVNVSPTPAPRKLVAASLNDPKSVIRALKKFAPKGNNREKLMTLLEEARKLKLNVHPHSFCFLLRSMFEISAKAYCKDHKSTGCPVATKADGTDRYLEDILRDVTIHLTKNKTDKNMVKILHGAMAEIAKKDGFLSVTSMNQLVHNPKFSVDETHISTLFNNIFPLLEEINR